MNIITIAGRQYPLSQFDGLQGKALRAYLAGPAVSGVGAKTADKWAKEVLKARRQARSAPAATPATSGGLAGWFRANRGALLGILLGGLVGLLILVFVVSGIALYLNRPVPVAAEPAELQVLNPQELPAEEANTVPAVLVRPDAYCGDGLAQVPGWSNGLCADEAFISQTLGRYPGYLFGPVEGKLYIVADMVAQHGYRDENGDGFAATLWGAEDPRDGHDVPACGGAIEVTIGKVQPINIPEGCVVGLGPDIED